MPRDLSSAFVYIPIVSYGQLVSVGISTTVHWGVRPAFQKLGQKFLLLPKRQNRSIMCQSFHLKGFSRKFVFVSLLTFFNFYTNNVIVFHCVGHKTPGTFLKISSFVFHKRKSKIFKTRVNKCMCFKRKPHNIHQSVRSKSCRS